MSTFIVKKKGARRFVCTDVKGRRARSKERAKSRKYEKDSKSYINHDTEKYEEVINEKTACIWCPRAVCNCEEPVTLYCMNADCDKTVNTVRGDYGYYGCCDGECMETLFDAAVIRMFSEVYWK